MDKNQLLCLCQNRGLIYKGEWDQEQFLGICRYSMQIVELNANRKKFCIS